MEKILERKLMNRSPGGRFPRIWRNIKKLGDMRTIEYLFDMVDRKNYYKHKNSSFESLRDD